MADASPGGRRSVLAIDIGASGGRAILGHFGDGRIVLEEVHRFANEPVQVGDTLHWDIFRLWHEVQQGILRAKAVADIAAIGIDTWGVDFGLLDARGHLIEHPIHYRDARTEGIPQEVYRDLSAEELFARTGLHALRLNTLFQLRALQKQRPKVFDCAATLLFVPDLLAYFLTGERACEHTIAGTSQLLRAGEPEWDMDLIRTLGLPERIFPRLVQPGHPYGTVQASVAEALGIGTLPVIAVAAHDTASAVSACSATSIHPLFLSCGTWSLLGTTLDAPCLSEAARTANLANEAGVGATMLLRNIMGLWLVQESKRWWQRGGETFSYPQLEQEAMDAPAPTCFINPNDACFEAPGNMPGRIRAYAARNGQTAPVSRGQTVRCIYESLALQYRLTVEQIERITRRSLGPLHVVGGGAQSKLLCQMSADALGRSVVAGPVEATALGNVLLQLSGLGLLGGEAERRSVLGRSIDTITYAPQAKQAAAFDGAYPAFLRGTCETR